MSTSQLQERALYDAFAEKENKAAKMYGSEEFEKLADKGNARKLYEYIRQLTKDFKSRADSYRTQRVHLVTDIRLPYLTMRRFER